MSCADFGRRAGVRRRSGSITTRIVVGLSPLWLGALFLAFENTSGRADKPLSTRVARAGAEQVAIAPVREPSPKVAMLTAETRPTDGRTPDAVFRRSSEDQSPQDADGARLNRWAPEKLDTLPRMGGESSITATVQQPTWSPKPRPRDLDRSSPDAESPTESPAKFPSAAAVSTPTAGRDRSGRWKRPPEVAADLGEEPPAEKTGEWEDTLAAPDASRLTDARVVIHQPGSGASIAARDLLSVLRMRGVGVAEVRMVGVSVSPPDIRYFHPRDRAIAEQVDRLLSRRGYRPELKDFTHYQPPPTRGTVEVWLPG